MSMLKESLRRLYKAGRLNAAELSYRVEKGTITKADYDEIIATPQGGGTGEGAAQAMKAAAYEEALTEVGVLPLER